MRVLIDGASYASTRAREANRQTMGKTNWKICGDLVYIWKYAVYWKIIQKMVVEPDAELLLSILGLFLSTVHWVANLDG